MTHDEAGEGAGPPRVGGRPAEAEAPARRAAGDRADDVNLLERRAMLAARSGRIDEARALLADGAARFPDSPRLHANLAESLRALGRPEEAGDAARRALALAPSLAQPRNTLGLLALDCGRLDEAAAAFREAARLRPDFAAAHVNLGRANRALGRAGEAEAAWRAALRIEPDNLEALISLGRALANARHPGQLDEALRCFERALELAPRRVDVRRAIAATLRDCGLHEEADRVLRAALAIDPLDAPLASELGDLAFARGQYDEASRYHRMATALDPDLAGAHYGLGLALEQQSRDVEAEAGFRRALDLDPTLPAPWLALARLQAERGDLEESSRSARRALAALPDAAGAYWRLASNLKAALPEADERAMEDLIARPDLSDLHRTALHFGLGAVLDARGLHPGAAAHFDRANALQAAADAARGEAHDPDRHARATDRLIANFTAEAIARRRGYGDPDPRPVFIVGLPRSGTTLVEQILASHSQVHGAGELPDLLTLFYALPRFVGRPCADPFEAYDALGPESAREAARAHMRRLEQLAPTSALRVVDKMPDNFKLLGLIAALFPAARVIHCRRGLRDVALSCWQTTFSSHPWSNDWDHMARRFADQGRLLEHWRRARPVDWLEVRYEELVHDPEGHARRLVDFLGLGWEPACLRPHATRRVVRTPSQMQVRRPVYTHSVGRWRKYASTLAPFFEALDRHGVAVEEPEPA